MSNRLTATDPPDVDAGGDHFELRDAVSFVWREWKFVCCIVALVMLVGVVVLLRQTPLYTATSEILLDRPREKVAGNEPILSDVNLDVPMIESQMAIIRSSVFLRRVVEKNHLAPDQAVAAAPSPPPAPHDSPVLDTVRSLFPGADPASHVSSADLGSDAIPANELGPISALKGAISVSRVAQRGYVLGISVTDPNPTRAAQLANAVADAYLVDKLDARFEAAKRAEAWLSERLSGLRDQLRDSEEAVAAFRAAHGLIQQNGTTLTQQQLSELNAKLVDARADAAQKKARVDLLAKGGSVQSIPDIGSSAALQSLRQQLSSLSAQEADLLARYGSAHPLVVNIRAQERDVERSIGAESGRIAAGIRNDYELARSRLDTLEKAVQQATGQINADDATAIHLHELERTAAVNKTLFEDFLQRSKVTAEQSTFEVRDARVITPAMVPPSASSPRPAKFLGVAGFLGVVLGLIGAYARERLNAGFSTPQQVEDMLALPVLSSVSHLKTRDLTVNNALVPIYNYPVVRPLSRYAEAIRGLRSGIRMTDVDVPPKVIQLTSAVPDEGKTTIALSLAASAAIAKIKVLFIDADLRHPTASRDLKAEKENGLVDLLMGHVEESEVVRFHEGPGYWMLPAGSHTQNPTDLLSSDRMKSLIAGFRENFDLVVIDSPPVGPVIDPVVVAQLSDKIVLVVRWGSTARELVKQCLNHLPGQRKVAGVVFNHVNDREAQKYGRPAYNYYYGNRYYKGYYSA
ncbi:MAG TPA: polysaccharide biosynthesis tyrosine autokinase [Stellaceae bacterium]|jgi:capsular exopolysaccharide synthesis family protein